MIQNPLSKINNSYADIISQMEGLIAADPRFNNLREGDLGKFQLEMFAGVTDIILYMLQRRSEECYYDTAQLRSSVTSLSRMFSYDITRPIPSQSKLKIVITGPLVLNVGDKIQVPYMTKFNANSSDFVLLQTMTYNVSQTDVATLASGGTIEITQDSFGNDITIVQGTIKERVIEGATNFQVGSTFQTYLIDDPTFSDLFGTPNDIFYNGVTKVYVGINKVDGLPTDENSTLFQIDRRSLINWQNIASSVTLNNGTKTRVCLVRTDKSGGVELKFGDDLFARMGARTAKENIFIQYLSTQGSSANKVGVIGNKATLSGKIYTNAGLDITSKVTFELYGNILNGADIESIDSIKNYSPKIYYSLDRIVSKDDYINYLKTLTTPVLIKNAIAWGEQEQKERTAFSDIKSFNIAFFSVLGSLYNINASSNATYTVKSGSELDSAVLDVGYSEDSIQDQSMFNVYTRQLMAKQLKQYRNKSDWFKVIYGTKSDGYVVDDIQALQNFGYSLTFAYSAYDVDNAMNISSTYTIPTITIDFSNSEMSKIASAIQSSLASVIDYRANATDNANYGNKAFENCVVRFDEEIYTSKETIHDTFPRFVIEFNKLNCPCYISSFSSSTLADYLAITDTSAVDVWYSSSATPLDYDNSKINSVVSKLDAKCPVTITNIYTSPTIHSFKAVGDVYVKPLYDKEEVKRTISNTVYKWLDQNADFGVNIRKSNIIEMYEVDNAVEYLNFDIVPTGKNYWPTASTHYDFTNIWKTDTGIPDAVKDCLTSAASAYYTSADHIISSKLTERNFYQGFVGDAWKNLLPYLPGGTLENSYVIAYIYGDADQTISSDISPAFVNVLENVKKVWNYKIKSNMINSYGNIEYVATASKQGGYTMGNEIVKLDLSTLNYIYK